MVFFFFYHWSFIPYIILFLLLMPVVMPCILDARQSCISKLVLFDMYTSNLRVIIWL